MGVDHTYMERGKIERKVIEFLAFKNEALGLDKKCIICTFLKNILVIKKPLFMIKPVCRVKMISINCGSLFCSSVFVKIKTAEITCANKTVKLLYNNGKFNMMLFPLGRVVMQFTQKSKKLFSIILRYLQNNFELYNILSVFNQ